MNDPDVKLLALIVLTAGLAGALWFFWDDIVPATDEPAIAQPEAVVEQIPAQGKPIHPLAPSTEPDRNKPDLVPLPSLDDSDGYFLLELVQIFGAELEPVLVAFSQRDKQTFANELDRFLTKYGDSKPAAR